MQVTMGCDACPPITRASDRDVGRQLYALFDADPATIRRAALFTIDNGSCWTLESIIH